MFSKNSKFLQRAKNGYNGWVIWCPACLEMHLHPDGHGWIFNGNLENPTFAPSFKHTGKQTILVDGEWTGEWVRDSQGNPVDYCCHYILTFGVLNYQSDCTHALAGKTVPLPEIPETFRDP